jgi:hypothetical protein
MQWTSRPIPSRVGATCNSPFAARRNWDELTWLDLEPFSAQVAALQNLSLVPPSQVSYSDRPSPFVISA